MNNFALDINPSLERSDLGTLLGSKCSGNFSNSTLLKIEELENTLKRLARPKLHYLLLQIDSIGKNEIYLDNNLFFKSFKLTKSMADCDRIICFVATLGKDIDKEIVELMNDRSLSKAYIFDAMASISIENLVETFHKRIRHEYAGKGRGVTLRFSPGYCDWSIKEQRKLFSLFGSNEIGVELTDSCLMKPRKSISGVMGIYPLYAKVSALPYNPCSECEKEACSARRN